MRNAARKQRDAPENTSTSSSFKPRSEFTSPGVFLRHVVPAACWWLGYS